MLQKINDKLEDAIWFGISTIAMLSLIIGILIMLVLIAAICFVLVGS